jgi:hypothetical protein
MFVPRSIGALTAGFLQKRNCRDLPSRPVSRRDRRRPGLFLNCGIVVAPAAPGLRAALVRTFAAKARSSIVAYFGR